MSGTPHFSHDHETVRAHGLELLRASLRVATESGVAPDSSKYMFGGLLYIHGSAGRLNA